MDSRNRVITYQRSNSRLLGKAIKVKSIKGKGKTPN